MSSHQKMIGIAVLVFVFDLGIKDASASCPASPDGFTCKCSGDQTKWVCTKWSGPVAPVLDLDFEVTYVSGVPNVTLFTADLGWELYSQVLLGAGPPADIGTLTLSDSGGDDYEVTIAKGTGAGAANVGTINLDDAGFTGYSSIAGGHISGDLTGGLTVVKDSGGAGGEVTLTIDGDVSGAVTIPVVNDFVIEGQLTANLSVTDTIVDRLLILNNVTSTVIITINDMSGAFVWFGDLFGAPHFAGDLVLSNGVPSGSSVTIFGFIHSTTQVDLNDKTVAGNLWIVGNNASTIVNGGAVSGTVQLGGGIGTDFSGSATFASVSSTGAIKGGIDSTWTGDLEVTGDMDGEIETDALSGTGDYSGQIVIGGSVTGDITLEGDVIDSGGITLSTGLEGGSLTVEGDVTSGPSVFSIADMISDGGGNPSVLDFQGDFSGTLQLDSGIKAGQRVRIGGVFTSINSIDLNNQAVAGSLEIVGGGNGGIFFGGAVSGTVSLADGSANTYSGSADFASVSSGGVIKTVNGADLDGEINITFGVAGDILVSGDCAGDASIGKDLSGDIDIEGALSGDIIIGQQLAFPGRIMVDGVCTGGIAVGEDTASRTLIHLLGGLGSGGTVEVNTSKGNFNAVGGIHVGEISGAEAVTFDGCIHIYDEDGTGDGGTLRGDITVVGCHATNADLNICVDGDISGDINIEQATCANQVAYSCGTCP